MDNRKLEASEEDEIGLVNQRLKNNPRTKWADHADIRRLNHWMDWLGHIISCRLFGLRELRKELGGTFGRLYTIKKALFNGC